MEPVFEKNFSDLSTGALMKLYEGLDEENQKVIAVGKCPHKEAAANYEVRQG
jgi:hypothetical protein